MKRHYVFFCVVLLSISSAQHVYTMHEHNGVMANQVAENEQCTICLDDMINGDRDNPRVRLTSCGHGFHHGCLVHWGQTRSNGWQTPNCPICRRSFEDRHVRLDGIEQPVQPVQEAPVVQAANQAQPVAQGIQEEQEWQTTMQQFIALLRELGLLDNLVQPLRVFEPRVRPAQDLAQVQAPVQIQPVIIPHAPADHIQVNPVHIDQPVPQNQAQHARRLLNRRSVIAGTALVATGALAYKLRKPIIKLYNQAKSKVHATYCKLLALSRLKNQNSTAKTQSESQ